MSRMDYALLSTKPRGIRKPARRAYLVAVLIIGFVIRASLTKRKAAAG